MTSGNNLTNSQFDISRLFEQAIQYHQAGQLEQAKRIYEEILAMDPQHADSSHLLGLFEYQHGNYVQAIAHIQQAVLVVPEQPVFFNNLGNVLREMGQLDKSLQAYQKALEINPDDAEIHSNLGVTLREMGQLDKSLQAYQKSVCIQPEFAEGYYNMGVFFQEQRKLKESVKAYQKAIQIQPDHVETYVNLGVVLREQGRLKESVKTHQKAVRIQPDYAEAHINLAITFLLQGRLNAGWKEFEWRWSRKRDFKRPLWDGTLLNGKSILIYAEQGFGDTIQFVRYIDLLPGTNTVIIFVCQPELKSLFKGIDCIDILVTKGEDIPSSDFQVPLLSLPYMFNTTLDTIPVRIPYLYPRPKADSVFHVDDSHGLKVGLVWAGRTTHVNDSNRSIDLKCFRCLLDVEGCQFFSLQVGEARADIKRYGYHHVIKDLGKQFIDFHCTALAILQLDLIISVDTAVAHLAGSLGKPVWTLLPFIPDWRWMLDRSDSPWYPSMTIFRQKEMGGWTPVFEQLKLSLMQCSPG